MESFQWAEFGLAALLAGFFIHLYVTHIKAHIRRLENIIQTQSGKTQLLHKWVIKLLGIAPASRRKKLTDEFEKEWEDITKSKT